MINVTPLHFPLPYLLSKLPSKEPYASLGTEICRFGSVTTETNNLNHHMRGGKLRALSAVVSHVPRTQHILCRMCVAP